VSLLAATCRALSLRLWCYWDVAGTFILPLPFFNTRQSTRDFPRVFITDFNELFVLLG
jgi:hypothetical protein